MTHNFALHEDYRDEEPTKTGGDRAFGCTVGGVLIAAGAAKLFVIGARTPVAYAMLAAGALLLVLGMAAPSCLAPLNRLWGKIGAAIAKVANPIILALLFFLVVTPMALVMRRLGKRPLSLGPDAAAASYWIERPPPAAARPGMRQQF